MTKVVERERFRGQRLRDGSPYELVITRERAVNVPPEMLPVLVEFTRDFRTCAAGSRAMLSRFVADALVAARACVLVQ